MTSFALQPNSCGLETQLDSAKLGVIVLSSATAEWNCARDHFDVMLLCWIAKNSSDNLTWVKGHKLVIATLILSFIFAHINAACALLMNVRSGPAERETASGSLQTPTHVQKSQEEQQQQHTSAALNSQCCAVSDVMLQIVLTGGIICAHPRRNSWVWGNNCALGCDGGLNVRCAHELLVSCTTLGCQYWSVRYSQYQTCLFLGLIIMMKYSSTLVI